MNISESHKKWGLFLFQTAGVIALFRLDRWLFLTLNHLLSILPDTLWSFITILGDGTILFAIFPMFFRRYHRLMLQGLFLTIVALLVIHGLKDLFLFPRPPALLNPDDFHLIGKMNKQHAFPSGHSATAVAAAILWSSVLEKKWHKWLFSMAALVCLSRIAVGVHWPTDILFGAALGILIGCVSIKLSKNWNLSDNFYCKLILLLMLLINSVKLYDFNHGYPLVTNLTYLIATVSLIATIAQLVALCADRFEWKLTYRSAQKAWDTILSR